MPSGTVIAVWSSGGTDMGLLQPADGRGAPLRFLESDTENGASGSAVALSASSHIGDTVTFHYGGGGFAKKVRFTAE